MKNVTLTTVKHKASAALAKLPEISTKYGPGIYGKAITLPGEVSSKSSFKFKAKNAEVHRDFSKETLSLIEPYANIDKHILDAFHFANLNDVLVIEGQSGKESEIDVECNLADENHVTQIIIIAGKNNKSTISIFEKSNSKLNFHSSQIFLITNANSKVNLTVIQNISQDAVQVCVKKLICKNESQVTLNEFATGTSNTYLRTKTYLQEPNASCEIYTTSITNNNEIVDAKVTALHNASDSESKLYSKAVVMDESKNIYRGNVIIPQNMRNCDGLQKQEVLLLSDKANAAAVPNLEIANNEVKCSHSSSITSLNEDKLFYLQSRGYNELEAKKLALTSFLNNNLEKMPISMQEIALEVIEKRVKK